MSKMKDAWLDEAEKERMMREEGITQQTLDKMQAWIEKGQQEKNENDK